MDPLLTTVLSGSYADTTDITLLRETLLNVSRYARALEAALPPGTLSTKGNSHSPPTDSSSTSPPTQTTTTTTTTTTDSSASPEPPIKKEGQEITSLSETFKRSMALSGSGDRFFGPSSSFALIDSAASEVATFGGDKDPYGFFQRAGAITVSGVKEHMRPVFWNVLPWEKPPPPDSKPFLFPDPDLLPTLIALYFDNVNFYMPLLHRPTIDRALSSGLHHSDPGFASVVLAMCALGSRYSNDGRVLLDGAGGSLHSSGFKWFRQVRLFGELAVTFVHGSSTQEKAWYLIGLGIRAAQDIGLNQKESSSRPTVDGELRKRIFWHLLFADSITASAVGRPPAIHLSDFDVDLPIECDDEYWEDPDPEKAFKQPPGKPSKVSYFCALLRLLQIHCKSHRDFPILSYFTLTFTFTFTSTYNVQMAFSRSVPRHPDSLNVHGRSPTQDGPAKSDKDSSEEESPVVGVRERVVTPPSSSSSSSGSPDSQASNNNNNNNNNSGLGTTSKPSLTTDGGASATTDNQPPAPAPLSAPTATPETLPVFDGIPLYSSDLSKPFPLFDEAEHGQYDWKRQLGELQALWDQAAVGGQGLAVQDLSSSVDGSAGGSGFVDSTFGGAGAASGMDMGLVGPPSSTGSFEPHGLGSRAPSGSVPLQQASTFDFGGSVLDAQGAALWIDVPSTYNMDDWGSYISNVNSLNTVPTQQYRHNGNSQSAGGEEPRIDFGFMTGVTGDSSERPGQKCTNCATFGTECTRIFMAQKKQQQASRKRVPVTVFSQTESIVDLRARMDPLLKKVLSGSNPPESPERLQETLLAVARYARSLEDSISFSVSAGTSSQPPSQPATSASTPSLSAPVSGNNVEVLDPGSDEVDFETALADNLRRSLMLTDPQDRFIGASSSVGFFSVAAQEMNEIGPIGLAGRRDGVALKRVDVDMPSECDDEYWDHPDPALAFKQPPEIPSKASFFTNILKLVQIQSLATKAFYSARRPDLPPGVSAEEHERATLAELDSKLNAWLDGLPEHLLSTLYNHVQILLHRPFVASRNHPSLALTSLAICTNAARACIRTAATHARQGLIPAPQVHMALFSSGLVLMLNIWRARRTGSALVDEVREMKNVYTCIAVLNTFEVRWHSAGRFSDLLTAMASIGGFPESPFTRPPKRSHESLTDGSDQRGAQATRPQDSNSPGREIPVNSSTGPENTQVSVKSSDSPFAPSSRTDSPSVFPFYAGGDLSQTFSDFNQVESSYSQVSISQPQNAQSQSTSGVSNFDSSITSHWPADTAMSETTANSLVDLPGAALWTGVPVAAYDLEDWTEYISNVEALNNKPPSNGREFTEMFQGVGGFGPSSLSGSSAFQAYPAQQQEYAEPAQKLAKVIGRTSRSGFSAPSDSLALGQLQDSMDPLLKTILSPTYQAPTNPAIIRETLVNLARYSRALEAAVPKEALKERTTVPPPPPPASSQSATLTIPIKGANEPPKECWVKALKEDPDLSMLSDNLKRSLMLTSSGERFFGPSSSVSLLNTALELTEDDPDCPAPSGPAIANYLRPEFWSVLPWEEAPPPDIVPFIFPEPDLLKSLINLYFDCVNVFIPVLHRPTFETAVESGLHLTDPAFGATVLGVCALGSRYSNDDRNLLEGTSSLHSSGYRWFRQMTLFRESSIRAPSLCELQSFCLAVIYLQGSSTPEKCWYLIGFGIRAAQDVGLNRKNEDAAPTVENELRKRIFWTLSMAEAVISVTVGRPPSINPSDFDVDPPIDCDDEYWENPDPALAFKQPEGKPSKMSFFLSLLKLTEIHYATQRAFYSVRRPEVPAGMTPAEWDRATLAGLDSSLNAWVDSVPDHLKWDPHSSGVFFDQSAMLFATYYYIQILAHRPFITVRNQPVLAFSSLAICTNAARACIRITETQSKKGRVPNPQMQVALFMSGLMLVLSIWRGKRTGITLMDERQEMQAVHSCINVLKTYEERWHLAGRFRDLLLALTCVSGCAMQPAGSKLKSGKRSRETLEGVEASSPTSGSATSPSISSRQDTPSDVQARSSPATSISTASEPVSESRPLVDPSMMYMQAPAPILLAGLIGHQQRSPEIPEENPPSFDFPLYSNDLSKPFPFNPSDESGWDNAMLQQQLDELEAMFHASGGEAPTVVGGNASLRGNNGGQPQQGQGQNHQDAFQKMFGEPSMFLTSSAPQQPPIPNAVPRIGGGGSGSGGPHDFASQLFSGGSLLDIHGAAIWTGVPSGTDLNDWRAYFSNVEGLKPGSSSLFSTGLGAPNHHPANPFSSESFQHQQQQQHVPASAPSRTGDVGEMNGLFGSQSQRSEGELRFNW
ncbi:hypothetical protein MD484_g4433, partial [Candolleomyces efflorescens]